MKMNRTMTVTVLGLALLAYALPTLAEDTVDLPAQAQRIWAPTGDLIGQNNHGTATFQAKDPHGNEAKGAEDWQLVQKYSGEGLFGYFRTRQDGSRYWLRASGDNGGTGGPVGKIDLGGNIPGKLKWSIEYRDFDYFYDRTSEMRAPGFAAPPPPPELGILPELNWRRGSLQAAYRLSDKFSLAGGFNRKCRHGEKGSLLRGLFNSGASVPGRKLFDTSTNEFWGGVGFATGSFGSDLNLSYRSTEGTRALEGPHYYSDDQTRFGARLGLSYVLNDRFKLVGHGATSKLENTGWDNTGLRTYDLNGETKTNAGQIGLLARLGKSGNLAASANFRSLDTDARANLAADIQQATDRKRDSQDYRVSFNYHGLAKTRLRLDYRYGTSNLDQTVAEGDVPGGGQVGDYQVTNQTRTRQDLGLRGRYRFGSAMSIKAVVAWRKLEIDQKDPTLSNPANPLTFWMGDRNQDRLRWELALRMRLGRWVRFDIGHQAIDQTFERKDFGLSESTWKANRGFTNLTWTPGGGSLDLYGMFSYGVEEYALTTDPVPTTDMNAIAYNGSTMRFSPGATLRLGDNLRLEGHYEGIRFEDTGNEDVIRKLQADHDRLALRAGYQVSTWARVSASYTRNEFDENRWDDYIHHLYAVSVSKTF
ncbi:MAG: hypothetical protein ABFS42_10735 [Candidatus Krumholzibacteriota bacterium]